MNKASISFEEAEKELLQNEEFRHKYEKLKPQYEIISQTIAIRNEQGIKRGKVEGYYMKQVNKDVTD